MNDYITPEREHSALLIIDIQSDFTLMGATVEIPGTLQAIQYVQRLVHVYREKGHPIFHIIRLYRASLSDSLKLLNKSPWLVTTLSRYPSPF